MRYITLAPEYTLPTNEDYDDVIAGMHRDVELTTDGRVGELFTFPSFDRLATTQTGEVGDGS